MKVGNERWALCMMPYKDMQCSSFAAALIAAMPNKILTLILGVAILSGCCAVNVSELDRLTLERQVASYEEAWSRGCIHSERGWLLRSIASHGYAAANLMVIHLKQKDSRFPPEDAVQVLEYVHLEGADLLGHEALGVLDDLARSASSEELRDQAKEAVNLIREQRPKHMGKGSI